MPTQSEVSTRLSAENSEYTSVMGSSAQLAEKTGKAITKGLDVKAGVVAIAAAVGINIASIAEKTAAYVFGITEKAKKDLEDLANTSADVTSVLERQFAARRGESQAQVAAQNKLNSLRKQSVALQAEEAKWGGLVEKIQKSIYADTWVGNRFRQEALNRQGAVQAKLAANAKEQQEAALALDEAKIKRMQQLSSLDQTNFERSIRTLTTSQQLEAIAARRAEQEKAIASFTGTGVELDERKKNLQQTILLQTDTIAKRKEEGDKRALELDEESAQHVKDNHELLVLEAKLKTGTLLPAERARLDILRLENKEKVIQANLNLLLSKPIKEWTEQDKQMFLSLQGQSKEIEKQIALKQELIDAGNNQVKVEKAVAEEVHYGTAALQSFVKEWTGWEQAIKSTGRGDRELSDRELERKIQTIQRDLFARSSAVTGRASADFFTGPQRFNLTQAVSELDLRRRVRSQAMAFGEGAAFNMNPGLSEQRFREILQGIDMSTAGKLASAVDKLTKRLDEPVKTIPLTRPSPFSG